MPSCGVYQILCKTTGHRYVGSAENIESRWTAHKSELRRGKHHSKALQYAWLLFGESDFEFSILETSSTDALQSRELHYITEFKPEFNDRQIPGKRSERKKKVSTTLRMPEELFHQMQEFCRIFRVSQTELMEKAVTEYVQKHGYRPRYQLKVTKDCYVLSRIDPEALIVLDVHVRNGVTPEELQQSYRAKFQAPVELLVEDGAKQ